MELYDDFNRIHNYLRISLTDNCNFRCSYCMPNEDIAFFPPKELMSADEIFEIAQVFVSYGVRKIRLTGGEPLIRKDFDDILKRLSNLSIEIAVTTNGFLLDKHIPSLKDSGVRSLNISIDTLQSDRFKKLTKRDYFDKVCANINLAIEEKFTVKLNMVVMRGVNEDEVLDFVELTKEQDINVRFIEFMPFSGNLWEKDKVFSTNEMLDIINNKYSSITRLENDVHDTSKSYKVNDYKGVFSFITTMSAPFCAGCNRLRLTADGKMKNCLFGKDEFSVLKALREGRNISSIIMSCVKKKHKEMGGQFSDFREVNPDDLENRSMIKIGG